ncbi:hypothetical protein COLO4_22439 [Corchorus olitorius]|uniref:Uncharacterized protein n=1 Tax=Corchorus olitorius TaxID=93759 RepID=A0A1R3ILW1_9ROSI|nr:hypothetical protein COLO4_22439 [Corchorus olitorius]
MCKNLRNTVLVQFSKYIGAAVAGWGTGYLLTETLGRNIMAHGKRMEALAEEMRNHPERAKEIGAKLRAYASELEPLAKKRKLKQVLELMQGNLKHDRRSDDRSDVDMFEVIISSIAGPSIDPRAEVFAVQVAKLVGAAVAGCGMSEALDRDIMRACKHVEAVAEEIRNNPERAREIGEEIGESLRAWAMEFEAQSKKMFKNLLPPSAVEGAKKYVCNRYVGKFAFGCGIGYLITQALDMAILRGLKRAEALVEGISNNPEKARQVEAIVSAAANEFEARRKK